MKMLRKALILAALGTAAAASLVAQIAPTVSMVEGTVTSIEYVQAGDYVEMIVMGTKVRVSSALAKADPTTGETKISSPTNAKLTLQSLSSNSPLPGRFDPVEPNTTIKGFRLGTTIVQGTWNTAGGYIDATDVFVEPAENIILGQVTAEFSGVEGSFTGSINGAQINLLPAANQTTKPGFDILPRVGTTGLRHEVGIELSKIPTGAQAAAEGYFAAGVFNAFVVDASNGTALSPTDQLAVTRAQVRERTPNNTRGDEYDIRGGIHLVTGRARQVAVYRIDVLAGRLTYTRLGAAVATIPDAVNPKFGTWRATGITPTVRTVTDPLGTAPSRIVVYLVPLNTTSLPSMTSFPAGAVLSAETVPDLIP